MSSEAPLLGCEIFAKTNQVLRGWWFVIFSAIMIMSFSGSTFIFEAYSDDIKTALDYDQTTINVISAYKNTGIVAGLIAEVDPHVAGSPHRSCGQPPRLRLLVARRQGRGQAKKVWQMCAAMFIGVNSGTFFTTGALVTPITSSWPSPGYEDFVTEDAGYGHAKLMIFWWVLYLAVWSSLFRFLAFGIVAKLTRHFNRNSMLCVWIMRSSSSFWPIMKKKNFQSV